MREKMITVIPQLKDSKVEFGWGGLIDISMNRMPDFNYADNSKRVLYMQGFSGSGVVATNAAAKVISDAILGNTKDLALFQAIRHTPFPGGKLLRGPVTAAGMLYHRLLDML
jgi:gamma-glutamylputrescine oxidase